MENIKIGLAQVNPTVGDYEGNTLKILDLIEKAEGKKQDLLVFPELALCGYPVWDLANEERFVKEGLKKLGIVVNATKKKHVTVILGFIDSSGNPGKSYNALAVIRNGKILHKQYKSLLPNYDVFLDRIFFLPAQERKVFKLFGTKFGAIICEDLWDEGYETKPVRELSRKGAKIIINISASPYSQNIWKRREKLLARKAKQNKLAIIYVNQVGVQDDLVFDGRSLIADKHGKICFKGEAFRENLYEFDLRLSGESATKVDFSSKIYETEAMYKALVLGVKDYTRKNNFKKAVVGLSGGIDSALVACIACDALGPENVLGVTMPGVFSSEGSVKDSERLAKNLGMEIRKHPITKLYQEKVREIIENKQNEDITPAENESVTLPMENLQARLRGLELMYISNDEGRILLSTGNKSEMAMGYCTLYGDMCGGLCVLGDVFKTQVYELSRYRNSLSEVIPEEILKKPPSAELRPDQADRDSLPEYEILDEILFLYIEKRKSRDKIVRILKKRVPSDIVTDVLWKVDHNEYKRRQTPPTLRVSERAWFGRRMPITNRFLG